MVDCCLHVNFTAKGQKKWPMPRHLGSRRPAKSFFQTIVYWVFHRTAGKKSIPNRDQNLFKMKTARSLKSHLCLTKGRHFLKKNGGMLKELLSRPEQSCIINYLRVFPVTILEMRYSV